MQQNKTNTLLGSHVTIGHTEDVVFSSRTTSERKVDIAGLDQRDSNVLGPQFSPQGVAESSQPKLRGGIRALCCHQQFICADVVLVCTSKARSHAKQERRML